MHMVVSKGLQDLKLLHQLTNLDNLLVLDFYLSYKYFVYRTDLAEG